jgi:hypothetical protein
MNFLDMAPEHEQTAAVDPRAPIWSAATAIAFIVAAGLVAAALDIPNFLQAGLATEPINAHPVDTGAERSGMWRHYEPVY